MSERSAAFKALFFSCVLMLCVAMPMAAQTGSASSTPDNSANNKPAQTTADQQSSAGSDRAITQKIRQAVIADKSLSMYAHNVKIITRQGAVTLKGPVRSDAEKQTVESAAAGVVGQGKVTDELTVKP